MRFKRTTALTTLLRRLSDRVKRSASYQASGRRRSLPKHSRVCSEARSAVRLSHSIVLPEVRRTQAASPAVESLGPAISILGRLE